MGAEPSPLLSAIVLLIPEAEDLVGRWRTAYDPSASLGVGAHVTLLYPFKRPSLLTAESVDDLAAFFRTRAPFSLEFGGVCSFRDLIYLSPEPAAAVHVLIEALAARYLDTPPYGGSIPVADLVPHLTVAQPARVEDLASISDAFCGAAEKRLPISSPVRQATLIAQDSHGSFRVWAVLPFGG